MKLFLTLTACLALIGCSRTGPSNTRVDPAFATLLPADTVLLTGIRVEALRTTPLYKKHAALIDKKLDDLSKRSGIDARQNLWELLVTSNGKDTIVFARGKFAEMGLEPKLEAQGAKRSAHRGYTMLGDDRAMLAFLSPTTAAAGPPAALKTMLDNKDRPKGGNVPALLEMSRQIPAGNHIWFAGLGGVRAPGIPPSSNLDNLNRMSQSVRTFQGGVELTEAATVKLEALCNSEKDAKEIHDALRGLLGIGRLTSPREMLPLFDAVQVSLDASRVRAEAAFQPAVIDQLIKLLAGSRSSISSPESRPRD